MGAGAAQRISAGDSGIRAESREPASKQTVVAAGRTIGYSAGLWAIEDQDAVPVPAPARSSFAETQVIRDAKGEKPVQRPKALAASLCAAACISPSISYISSTFFSFGEYLWLKLLVRKVTGVVLVCAAADT